MSPRLEAARRYRAQVGPRERVEYRPLQRAQDFRALGMAGHAVAELYEFAQGLAMAYGLREWPSPMSLAPAMGGELAGSWADNACAAILSWYARHFEADEGAPSLGTRHRTPTARVRA